ncbi:hypothetical protein LEP1GSC188_3415 [Leptospira weilii serovar Topaz str. LT2116]|uniref:Cyanophage baseplate Pam3 plug gp18 domain-containing protein n=1 Tax=Leptospira weilii serovar Topaz str. LT2116 TaxID=1088540 RepID=M3G858_9LEPT|nr:hypothetical protein LEP1GSC188_3415 [Leptospira weilii serovar Topaz str. LT2116]
MIRSLPIRFEELPVSKVFQIGDKDFEFEFRYNSRFDFISLYVKSNSRFLHTSKLSYGIDCLSGFANFSLVPLATSDLSKNEYSNLQVNKETFGKNVLLFYDDGKG